MHGTGLRFGKNVYEILSKLPQHGVGTKISRVTWLDNSFWTVTEVKMGLNGKTGESYGILTWRGDQTNDTPIRINGSLKKLWRQLSSHNTTNKEWPSLAITALQSEEQDTSSSSSTDTATTTIATEDTPSENQDKE